MRKQLVLFILHGPYYVLLTLFLVFTLKGFLML
nr:MAG TPA: hypothetical protein [Caudoviricetes sp.]DAO06679.1 MAG TPA: hypothetical protein [Caudoviricetes sp.]